MPELTHEVCDKMKEAGFSTKEIDMTPLCFDTLDKDRSGYIDAEELREALQTFGCDVSDNSVRKMLQESDHDDDGKVSFEEFVDMVIKKRKDKQKRQEKLRQALKCFDEDDSGYLERHEIREVLTTMGMEPMSEEDVDSLLEIGDLDGDGKLSIEEFVRVLTLGVDDIINDDKFYEKVYASS